MADAQRIVVAGESHCRAYDGISLGAVTVRSLPFSSDVLDMAEGDRLRPSILEDLRGGDIAPGSADNPHLVLTLSGSALAQETLHAIWRDHDFVLPSASELTDWSQRCLPLRLVDQWLQRTVDRHEAMLGAMRATGIRVGAVLPPPPTPRTSDKLHALLVANNLEPYVAAPPIRAKLHWLMRQKLSQVAARAGVGFVDTWTVLAEDEMFLRPAFELDGQHVTRAGAEAVVPALCAVLGVS